MAVAIGIIFPLLTHAYMTSQAVIYEKEPVEVVQEPVEVIIEVEIDWTPERIEQEIRDTFPESPDLAVAIARCESGLDADIQSRHILSYGREQSFGVFQIHAKDHHATAVRLGLENYKTDPAHNIKLARHIYDNRIKNGGYAWQDWSCYKNGGYKKFMK